MPPAGSAAQHQQDGPPWPLPPDHVPRPRLVARVLGSRRPVALVAGGGYGKTAVASEAALAHAGPVVALRVPGPATDLPTLLRLAARHAGRAGASDLARLLDVGADPEEVIDDLHRALPAEGPSLLLLLDEVQHLEPRAAAWVTRLLEPPPAGLRMALVGRDLPTPLADASARGVVESLGPADLRFDDVEIAELGHRRAHPLSAAAAADVGSRTDGWPALVAMHLTELTAPDPGGRVLPDRALAALVNRHLATMSAEDRAALVQAARLPLLHPTVDAGLGAPGLVDRALAAGLPLTVGADARWRLADPVAEHLRTLAPLDPDVGRSVAAAYQELGEGVLAARMLLAAGAEMEAAATAARWQTAMAEGDEADEVAALLDALPPRAVEEHPRVLLVSSWAHHRLGHATQRAAALDRARGLSIGDPVLRREVDAEWSWVASGGDDHETAADVARRVLAEATLAEAGTRSRALAGLGMALARRHDGDGDGTDEARRALEAAIQLFEDRGEREMAAEALLFLGYHQHYDGGRAREGAAALRRALALVPGRTRLRARLTVCLGEVLAGAGDHDGARTLLDEAGYLAGTVGNAEIAAYAAWVRMDLDSRDADGDGVRAAIAAVRELRGEWWSRAGGGAMFLCDATVAAARVDLELAAEQLAALRQHPASLPVLERVAEAAVFARTGPPARVLTALATTHELPPRLRWWAALMRAAAHQATGDAAASRLALEAMADEAAAIGQPHLPAAVEGALLRTLGEAPQAAEDPPVVVTALGGFEVRRDAERVDLPPGHARRLVQLLAAGGPARVDTVLDLLWPEVDLQIGRRRLRNVLLRLRTACPGLVERAGDQLVLGPRVRLDVDDFEEAAERALEGDLGAARAAVTRYAGDLLHDLPEEEWMAARRERLRLRLLDLLDLLVDAAIVDDDLDEALRLTERAIDADPLDDRRYLTAVALLLDRGRVTTARSMLGRAEQISDELGLPPSRAHVAMRERLKQR